MSWWSGSTGAWFTNPERSVPPSSGSTMIGWVDPVARTVSTSDCIPTA